MHGLRCATSSSTDGCDIIYPLIYTILIHVSYTYMHFEWNTFASNWNHGRISCDAQLQGTYVRIEQTSEALRVTYVMCIAGGRREDWN